MHTAYCIMQMLFDWTPDICQICSPLCGANKCRSALGLSCAVGSASKQVHDVCCQLDSGEQRPRSWNETTRLTSRGAQMEDARPWLCSQPLTMRVAGSFCSSRHALKKGDMKWLSGFRSISACTCQNVITSQLISQTSRASSASTADDRGSGNAEQETQDVVVPSARLSGIYRVVGFWFGCQGSNVR